ncbi:IS1380 family transposase, partial [Patulibacter sp. NPDC049589]|uniref:IS1380 family transposase n=1 Tax=Patulibacter sp. NPDC049589 TaxID=3154731 RepID=UPI0034424770
MVHDHAVVSFDDERSVANAGVMLPAILADRLGLVELVDRWLSLGDVPGAANVGRKVASVVHAMTLGADSIDDCAILKAGQTEAVLGFAALAPSTLGTFLRAFTFGHVRQADRVFAEMLRRAWTAGAGPGDGRLVVDVDSFVGQTHDYAKEGASYGYSKVRGYHPLLATRAETGEVLHIRFRKGSANTARGVLRFVDELLPRLQRAGATGEKLLRADSGFWNNKLMDKLEAAGWSYSIGARMQKPIRTAVEAIDDDQWTVLADYPKTGVAEIAETVFNGRRLIVRRVRLLGQQDEMFPQWRHFPFFTNRTDPIDVVEAEHRQHAVVELSIRDLKDQGLAHFPSGRFNANGA